MPRPEHLLLDGQRTREELDGLAVLLLLGHGHRHVVVRDGDGGVGHARVDRRRLAVGPADPRLVLGVELLARAIAAAKSELERHAGGELKVQEAARAVDESVVGGAWLLSRLDMDTDHEQADHDQTAADDLPDVHFDQ